MEIKGYYEYLVSSKMYENQLDNPAESEKEEEGFVPVKEHVSDGNTARSMAMVERNDYLVLSKMNENQADNQAESDKEQEGIVHVKTKENVSDGNGVPEPVDQSQGEEHQGQESCRIGSVSNQTDSSLCQDENNNTTRSMASQGVSEPCDQSQGEVQYQGQKDRLMGSVSDPTLSSPCKAISDPCSSKQFKSPKKDILSRWNEVEFVDGCVDICLYAGEPKQWEWNKENLTEYYFQTPKHKSLVIRFSKQATINQTLKGLLRKWATFGVIFQDPFVTFKGQKLDGDSSIFDIPQRSALIIFDKEVNEEYTLADGTHSGKPWTCKFKLCGRGFTTHLKFENHARSSHTKKEHVPMEFEQQNTFGRIMDRYALPWGCPNGPKARPKDASAPVSKSTMSRDPRPRKIFESRNADPG